MDWLAGQNEAAAAGCATDARPATGHPRRHELDPEAERRDRLRGGLVVGILIAVFIAGSAAAVLGEGGILDRLRLTRELQRLQAEVETQSAGVHALQQGVHDLQRNPMARERIVREQLGYAKPGEVVFLLPEESDPTQPPPPAPDEVPAP